MWFVLTRNQRFLVVFISLSCLSHSFHVLPIPCNVSLTESCPAYFYYVPEKAKNIEETSSLFRVNSDFVNRTSDGFVISVYCSCPADHDYFTWHMDYTVQPGDTWETISSKFGSFVMEKPDKTLIVSQNITLELLCGCSETEKIEVVTYKVVTGETLFIICARFGADVQKTAEFNKLENRALIHAGDIIFIPQSVGLKNLILAGDRDPKVKKESKSRMHIVIGTVIAALCAVLLSVFIIVIFWRCYYKTSGIRRSKSCTRGLKCLPCFFSTSSSHTDSEESVVSSFNSNKAAVFSYSEVCDATSNFNIKLKIGQGSYGLVYRGKLRENEVAIKQMKNTKSKEFFSELNILCKVHHTNLIELIGYAAGGDFLFLVYELAQNGALSDHLHNPAVRGYKPLSWIARVHIALDSAKGLEYIHAHAKGYYVHRDVKTSNILLDSNFRAKIADFGLVKLLEHSPETATAASRIVGTFGYLAPEYVRDGFVSTKSDVYGFGVVLMELLTGQTALSRDATSGNAQYSEHRSLVEYMLSILENDDRLAKLTQCVDQNIVHYHKDSLFQMAILSKDCVEEDWNRRPDMSQVVLRLSHILISSKKWEKAECTMLMC